MALRYILLTICSVVLIALSSAHTPGTITVDTLSFGKILNHFDIVFAKFDDKYPYGEKQDHFKKFAESVATTKGFIVVEIPITDYGEMENHQLAQEYAVTKADFPAYKLFIKGQPKPIDYSGDKTEDSLKLFLSQHTNLWFGLSGTIQSLDPLAGEFFDASTAKDEARQKSLLDKARKEVEKLTDKKEARSGEAYVRIMESIMKQDLEFLKREGRRVQNLLKGKITTEKKEELQYRANILLSFNSRQESTKDDASTDGQAEQSTTEKEL